VKFLTTLIAAMSAPSAEGSVRTLVKLVVTLTVAVALASTGFHVLMAYEGRSFSWPSSVYWAIVTMTTLGYGDIVFESDLGRLYSLLVLIAGAILILVMLPFTFIQLVYLPWRQATRRASAPRELPASMSGHVILTGLSPIEESLIQRIEAAGVPYALLVEDLEHGVNLHDAGYRVAVGALDDPETYRAVRADRAALMFTSLEDTTNTNAVFTMREVTESGLVVATANSGDSVDVLQLAGCDRVLQLGELLGRALARRILAPSARSSIVAEFEDVVIAETSAAGTELVGRTLAQLGLRRHYGVSVVGLWDRGSLQVATPDLEIEESSILLLAGTRDQVRAYDRSFASGVRSPIEEMDAEKEHVVILGGGRVGRATARALREAGKSHCIVERLEERVRAEHDYVVGDAEDIEVLRRAGIDRATAVVVTTHDDDMNLYLTLYCRRLRPKAEVLGRVNVDRNLSTMHRAGADFVLSYASVGATEVWNTLKEGSTLLLTEGLIVFRVPMPRSLAGRRLRETDIPTRTGCYVVGISEDGSFDASPDPDTPLPTDAELLLIGDEAGEERFLDRYVSARDGGPLNWRNWFRGERSADEHPPDRFDRVR
jgi:voltage-gated potassium channel